MNQIEKENERIAETSPTFEVDILIVDDSKSNLQLLQDILRNAGYKVRPAESGELAFRSAKAKLPILILLDIRMPDMDGFELCRKLKADEATSAVPIIFISALEDLPSKMKGFQVGGVDYITKPFLKEEVLARVKNQIDVRQMQLHLQNQNNLLLNEIAKQRINEKVLFESEERFRNLFDNSPIGNSMTGIDGSIHTNQAFCSMIGYQEEELRTKKWVDISYPDDIEETNRYVKLLLDGKISQARFEKRYVHKNGKIVWTDISTYLQRDKDEKPQYFITAITDITERKFMTDYLKKSEKFLDRFINTIGDPIFVKDEHSRMVYANDAFCRTFNLPREEIIGKTLVEEVPEDQVEHFMKVDRKVLFEGKEDNSEEQLTVRGGKPHTIVTMKKQLIDDAGNKFLVGMIHDITEIRENEERIKHFNEELEQIVQQRTLELHETILELEEQTRIFVGRELTMIELKAKIEELEKQLLSK
jgi:PAS domain S-box-containing protein